MMNKKLSLIMLVVGFGWNINNVAMDIEEKPVSISDALKKGDFDTANKLIKHSSHEVLFYADKQSGRLPFDSILSYIKDDANDEEKKHIELQKLTTVQLYLNKAGDKAYFHILRHKDSDGCNIWRKIVGSGNPGIIKAAVDVTQKRTEMYLTGDCVRELLMGFEDDCAGYDSPLSYAVMEEKDAVAKILLECAHERNPQLAQELVQSGSYYAKVLNCSKALEWMQSFFTDSKEPSYAWFANSFLGKTFILDAPAVRTCLIKYASEDYLKRCFQAMLDQFHDIQEQRKQGQSVDCVWLASALLEFNQKDSQLYSLSREEIAALNNV